jgi:twinkle protein
MNVKTFNHNDFKKYFVETEHQVKILNASAWADDIDEYIKNGARLSGATMPWAKTHDLFRFRSGEVTLWQGINGHGKSQLLGQVCLGFLAQNENVCIASFEMTPVSTYFRMLRQAAMTNSPAKAFSDKLLSWLDDKFWIYDHLGAVSTEQLFAAIRYAGAELNIKHFIIDNMMRCVRGEDDHTGQKVFIEELSSFAKRYKMHIHVVHHVRKGVSEEAIPGKFDSRGSGSITDGVENILTVWRNKAKEEKIRANKADDKTALQSDAIISCDKNRNGAWEGKIFLWFDPASLQYVSDTSGRPFNILEGSFR